jgi:hypothetical protein
MLEGAGRRRRARRTSIHEYDHGRQGRNLSSEGEGPLLENIPTFLPEARPRDEGGRGFVLSVKHLVCFDIYSFQSPKVAGSRSSFAKLQARDVY